MSRKPSSSNWGNGRYLIAILLILILAFALRLHNLTADAPLGISPTLELSLDGPATIMAGRDMALFGQWQAVPGPHQLEIMYPFMNWLAFVIFRLVGSGYWSANFISVVSGVLSVALVAGFARQHFGRRAALIAAFFLAINYIFIIYNRDPMAYTTVACSMAFVLYAWGRGLRQPVWFFNSGAGTAFAALFIKLPAIAFVPAAFVAFLWLIWQQRAWPWRNGRAYIPLLLFIAGGGIIVAAWGLFLYQAQPTAVSQAYYARTLSTKTEIEENVRAALMSVLFMGVDFGFVWRMLPLFILAYGYTFGRLAQLFQRPRPYISPAEGILLAFLLSSLAMLYISFIRPLRYQIVIIPQMSLVAGLALDRLWKRPSVAPLATLFNRLYPLFLYAGLTYFLYQVITAVFTISQINPIHPDFAGRWFVPEVSTLFLFFIASLIISILLVMAYLIKATRNPAFSIVPASNHGRRLLVGLFLVAAIMLQTYQYATMQQTAQFTTIEAARQFAQDFPESTILSGPFAPPLALESHIPAIWMLGNDGQAFLQIPFTHLAVDSAGPISSRYLTEDQLRDNVPELFDHAKLVKTYMIRDYTVNVYEIDKTLRTSP